MAKWNTHIFIFVWCEDFLMGISSLLCKYRQSAGFIVYQLIFKLCQAFKFHFIPDPLDKANRDIPMINIL